LASSGETDAPCGDPLPLSDHFPSSMTPAASHLSTSRRTLSSAIRCRRNFRPARVGPRPGLLRQPAARLPPARRPPELRRRLRAGPPRLARPGDPDRRPGGQRAGHLPPQRPHPAVRPPGTGHADHHPPGRRPLRALEPAPPRKNPGSLTAAGPARPGRVAPGNAQQPGRTRSRDQHGRKRATLRAYGQKPAGALRPTPA